MSVHCNQRNRPAPKDAPPLTIFFLHVKRTAPHRLLVGPKVCEDASACRRRARRLRWSDDLAWIHGRRWFRSLFLFRLLLGLLLLLLRIVGLQSRGLQS